MPQSIARRRAGRPRPLVPSQATAIGPRLAAARPSGSRGPGATSSHLRRRSIAAAAVAYVLVGAFLGLAAWKLTETAVETRQGADELAVPDTAVATVVPPAPPAVPSAPHPDAGLLALLQQLAPNQGWAGIYIRNLTTGAEASVNAERVFPAASLYKLPIMVETIRQIQLGRISADQMMTVTRAHFVPGSGVLQARIGDSLPVREVLRLMIGESDNVAAMMLLDLTGLNNVNLTMQGLDLRSTKLLDWRAPGANDGIGPYATSPADMGRLLDTIADRRLVSQEVSDEALRLLAQTQASDLLGEALPWNVKVAHKWGEIPGARHEAGIVYAPRFQYVVVIMTETMDPQQSPDYIRGLSKAIYDFFDAAPGQGS